MAEACGQGRPARRAAGSRAGALALAALTLALAGCVFYEADVRVESGGAVTVRERVAVDPEWKESIRDTLQAARTVMDRYVREARERGGKVVRSNRDSALVEFRFKSLAAFARAWPDSNDEGQRYDRSLYRRREEGGRALEELILFRMSPPERKPGMSQRYPVLTFWVTPPAPPVAQNAHFTRGDSYGWRFTDAMSAPDSVWIAWPAAPR